MSIIALAEYLERLDADTKALPASLLGFDPQALRDHAAMRNLLGPLAKMLRGFDTMVEQCDHYGDEWWARNMTRTAADVLRKLNIEGEPTCQTK